ncbi:MAG: hypothetical protein AAFX79_06315 [Planctomycetota bacterium]
MVASLALVIAAGVLAGCNIVAPAVLLVQGPPKVPREFTLDRGRVTAIMLDDPDSIVPSMAYRRELLATAQRQLASRAKVKDVVDSREVMATLQRDSAEQSMSIVGIGRAIGAEQIIWVRVERFRLAADTGELRPNSRLRVKVIDVANNERLWPEPDSSGHVLDVTMPVRPDFVPSSGHEQRQALDDLAAYSGRAVSELFYNEERVLSARAGN